MPLWRVSDRGRFLHDGRSTNITDAITAHGQAQQARDNFLSLVTADTAALLAFLNGI